MNKKIFIIFLLMLFFTNIVFAEATPEEIIISHYQYDLENDMNQLLNTYNLDYINKTMADMETFKIYIGSAKQVYTTLASEVSNIIVDYSEDKTMALVKFNVIGEFKVNETNEILPLSKTYGAFIENTVDGWKINFIMDYDLMLIKLEAGSMYSINLLTEEIAEENLQLLEMNTDYYGNLITDPEIAIASLEEFNKKTEEALLQANPIEEVVETETIIEEINDQEIETNEEINNDEIIYDEIIYDEIPKEESKSPFLFITALFIIIGGSAYYFLVFKKKK